MATATERARNESRHDDHKVRAAIRFVKWDKIDGCKSTTRPFAPCAFPSRYVFGFPKC